MMEENNKKKIVDYDNKEQDISTQIKTLDIAFVQLREDVNKIKENMDRFRVNETTEKTNEVIQKPEQGDKAKDETDGLKSEVVQLKKEINPHNSKSKDRKSTRLNSSHVAISYAVFCLNEKK